MRVMIYGAGSMGRQVYQQLRQQDNNIIGFFDSDPNKIGNTLCGLPIKDFQVTPRREYDIILIASYCRDEIGLKLIDHGLVLETDFFFFDSAEKDEDRALSNFQRLKTGLAEYCNMTMTGKQILHIGCGNMILNDLFCLLSGAEKIYAIDPSPISMLPDVTLYYSFLSYIFANQRTRANSDWELLGTTEDDYLNRLKTIFYQVGFKTFINMDYYQFYPIAAEKLPFTDGYFNISHSNAVFEHISAPEPCIQELARVTVSGGITMHCIDLRDHLDNNSPYSHLSCSAEEWQKKALNENSSYIRSNRWRGIQYKAAFEAAGFEIVHYELVPPPEDVYRSFPNTIDPTWKEFSLAELEAIGCLIYARKK